MEVRIYKEFSFFSYLSSKIKSMTIRHILLFLILLSCQHSFAQQSKLSFELNRLGSSHAKTGQVSVLIQGNPARVKEAVDACGGSYKYNIGSISSVSLPVSAIQHFASYHFVSRMEQGTIRVHPLNDTMIYLNNIAPVNNGMAPLSQAYDGKGIVCGFIDTGIDFSHGDFKDSVGKSRIKFIWDQTKPHAANTPQPFNYGQEWTNIQIDSGLCTHRDSINWGHGTRVAGTAAGNGKAVNRYAGAAPRADIITVAIDFNNPGPTIADAAVYIFRKAQALGKPCVINCSLGSDFGSHDATDLTAVVIDSLLNQQAGRVFVAAAGNSGDSKIHLRNTLSSDSSFTWMALTSNDSSNGNNILDVQVFGDTTQMKNIEFALAADKPGTPFTLRGRTAFRKTPSNLNTIVYDTIRGNNSQAIAHIQSYQQLFQGTYSMEYYIVCDTGYFFRLITRGTGTCDAWCGNFVATRLPSVSDYPPMQTYKLPDTDETIETSFQCSPHVISVANYVNKNCFTDEGDTVICDTNFVFRPRRLAPSSSHGPTRTGLQKPDIAATGDYVMSCFVVSLRPYFSSTQIAKGGMHIAGGGTSQASPVIAGIAALYLQQNPSATHMQVKNAITCSARSDIYTGTSLPDYKWGYGKADAFHALTGCSPTFVNTKHSNEGDLQVWPNPVEESATISWPQLSQVAELSVTDVLGQEIKRITLKEGMKSLTLSRGELKPGIYFIVLRRAGNDILTKKIALH
jgi:subtilisin family serine protease